MPWPRGVKRVGYVKKDGTPHAKKGERIAGPRIEVIRKPDPNRKTTIRRDVDPDRIEKTVAAPVPGVVDSIHGATGRPVIEPCPACRYAYADGGFCGECGWTQTQPGCPHCKKLLGLRAS